MVRGSGNIHTGEVCVDRRPCSARFSLALQANEQALGTFFVSTLCLHLACDISHLLEACCFASFGTKVFEDVGVWNCRIGSLVTLTVADSVAGREQFRRLLGRAQQYASLLSLLWCNHKFV